MYIVCVLNIKAADNNGKLGMKSIVCIHHTLYSSCIRIHVVSKWDAQTCTLWGVQTVLLCRW